MSLSYAIGSGFVLAVWVVCYRLLPRSRGPLLWAGLAWGHAGPISEYWHLKDYWHPEFLIRLQIHDWVFGIEDYVFAFAFAGLCACAFDVLIRTLWVAKPLRFNWDGFAVLFLTGFASLGVMAFLVEVLALNSLYAIVLSFLVGGLILLVLRPAWCVPAVWTSGLAAAGMWLFYAAFYLRLFPGLIDAWWDAQSLCGFRPGGVPVEEVFWAGAAGLFAGPAVRFCMTLKA